MLNQVQHDSGRRNQPARVPVIGKLPKAPAPTVPVRLSPSIVASQSSVIGIGTVMFIFQLIVLPSTLPSTTSADPIAPELVPVKLSPSLFTVRVDFWSPSGDLVTHSQVPSTSAIRVSPYFTLAEGVLFTTSTGMPSESSCGFTLVASPITTQVSFDGSIAALAAASSCGAVSARYLLASVS